MRTPASIKGHPLHAMLIVFPVGLFIFSLICDIIARSVADPTPWLISARYSMVAGFIGALVAAVPGAIDLLSIRRDDVRTIGLTHMGINLVVVALYAVNIWLRIWRTGDTAVTLWLAVLAVILLGVSGWLGGQMVHVHRVGVVEPGEPAEPTGTPSTSRRTRGMTERHA